MDVRCLALWKGETLSWSQSIEPPPNLLRQKQSGWTHTNTHTHARIGQIKNWSSRLEVYFFACFRPRLPFLSLFRGERLLLEMWMDYISTEKEIQPHTLRCGRFRKCQMRWCTQCDIGLILRSRVGWCIKISQYIGHDFACNLKLSNTVNIAMIWPLCSLRLL